MQEIQGVNSEGLPGFQEPLHLKVSASGKLSQWTEDLEVSFAGPSQLSYLNFVL